MNDVNLISQNLSPARLATLTRAGRQSMRSCIRKRDMKRAPGTRR